MKTQTLHTKASEAGSKTELNIAVVGHTNVGKTSLLRTLVRNQLFGEVENYGGTTKKVATNTSYFNYRNTRYSISYLDTPGMDSTLYFARDMDALRFKDQDSPVTSSTVTKSNIIAAIEDVELQEKYPAEINCLEQVNFADISFYVVDTREPVLAKYQVELELIQMLMKPIIIILNFPRDIDSKIKDWQSYLIAHGFHTYIAMSTLVNMEKEHLRLIELLNILGKEFETLLTALQLDYEDQRDLRISRSATFVTDTILKLSAYRLESKKVQSEESQLDEEVLTQKIVNDVLPIIQNSLKNLVESYHFTQENVDLLMADVNPEVNDLFNFHFKDVRSLVQESQNGLATGAAAGLGVDIAVAGISLGSAAAIGAVTGALYSLRKHTSRLLRQLINGNDICVSEHSLAQVIDAIIGLVVRLEMRGHGAIEKLTMQSSTNLNPRNQQILEHESVKAARIHPDWVNLDFSSDPAAFPAFENLRREVIEAIFDDIDSRQLL